MKIIHIDQLHRHLGGPGLNPGGKLIIIFVNEITFFKLLNQYPVRFDRTLRDVTLNGFKVITDKLIAENHCWLCTHTEAKCFVWENSNNIRYTQLISVTDQYGNTKNYGKV